MSIKAFFLLSVSSVSRFLFEGKLDRNGGQKENKKNCILFIEIAQITHSHQMDKNDVWDEGFPSIFHLDY